MVTSCHNAVFRTCAFCQSAPFICTPLFRSKGICNLLVFGFLIVIKVHTPFACTEGRKRSIMNEHSETCLAEPFKTTLAGVCCKCFIFFSLNMHSVHNKFSFIILYCFRARIRQSICQHQLRQQCVLPFLRQSR